MKKLFTYSGVATIVSILLLILCAINFYVPFWSIEEPRFHSIQPDHVFGMLISLIWIVFFCMVIFCGEKDSRIKIAAIPGLISMIMDLGITSTIVYSIYDLTSNYTFIGIFLNAYGIIDMVLFFASIILLGVFMHNKLVLTAGICNTFFVITNVLLNTFIPKFLVNDDIYLSDAYDIWSHSIAVFLLILIIQGSRILYLYAFYRMGRTANKNITPLSQETRNL